MPVVDWDLAYETLLLRKNEGDLPRSQGAYYRAAAVLTEFDPETLLPAPGDPAPRDGELEDLKGDSEPRQDHGRMYALKDSQRRLELSSLPDLVALRAAFVVNTKYLPADDNQGMLASYLAGTAAPLSKQTLNQLSGTVQVCSWFQDTRVGPYLDLPPYDDARDQWEWAQLRASLGEVRTNHFRGREDELNVLQQFVGRRPTTPMVVWGSGGIGKTALTAAFLLDQMERAEPREHALPTFVWLDFYRSSLVRTEDPRVLLQEAALYLTRQKPGSEARKRLVQFAEDIAEHIKPPQPGKKSTVHAADVDYLIQRFAEAAAATGPLDRPMFWVFDSLEELQYENGVFVDYLWDFCQRLHTKLPAIWCFLVGRAPVRGPGHRGENELELKSLDPDSGAQLAEWLGVSSDRARELAESVGLHPFQIRFAAEVLVRELKLGSLGTGQGEIDFSLTILPKQRAQIVFRRFVDHLHDVEVRRLVNPGLTLRRVTPDLIRQVLALPCRLTLHGKGRPRELFQKLKRETSVVGGVADDVVYFRPEFRREVLPVVRQMSLDRVTEIHNLAIAYYERLTPSEPRDRAEEIYHRLMRGQADQLIERRWVNGVGEFLAGSIDELPWNAAIYLAAKIGGDASKVSQYYNYNISQFVWELQTARRVRETLDLDEPDLALSLLQKRYERTDESPLFALEARALRRLGRLDEARTAIRRGLGRSGMAAKGAVPTDLLLLRFWIDFEGGEANPVRYAEAEQILQTLWTSAGTLTDSLHLDLLHRQAVLNRTLRRTDKEAKRTLRSAADALRDAVNSHDLIRQNSKLCRRLAAEVGDSGLLAEVVEAVGLGTVYPLTTESLSKALADWDVSCPDLGLLERIGVFPLATSYKPRRLWEHWLQFGDEDSVGRTLGTLLRLNPPAQVVRELCDALRLPDESPRTHADDEWLMVQHDSESRRQRTESELAQHVSKASELEQFVREYLGRSLTKLTKPTRNLHEMIRDIVC